MRGIDRDSAFIAQIPIIKPPARKMSMDMPYELNYLIPRMILSRRRTLIYFPLKPVLSRSEILHLVPDNSCDSFRSGRKPTSSNKVDIRPRPLRRGWAVTSPSAPYCLSIRCRPPPRSFPNGALFFSTVKLPLFTMGA